MTAKIKKSVAIIGSGNLAWHLASRLSAQKQFRITVYNRQASERLSLFKKRLKCDIKSSLSNIETRADYYILCVKDEAIHSVSKKIKVFNPSSVIIHVSGSRRLSEINPKLINRAVLYPLQTFSFSDEVNWKEIPVLTEANNSYSFGKVNELAALLTEKIYPASTSERLRIHLAAVMVNNFPNALYAAADGILKEGDAAHGFDLKIFLPLIQQGVNKLSHMSPLQAQTGPAKRGDKRVIRQHLQVLKNSKHLQEVYKQLSLLISAQHKG